MSEKTSLQVNSFFYVVFIHAAYWNLYGQRDCMESDIHKVHGTYIPVVAQCLSPRPNWDPPAPLPQASVSPPRNQRGEHLPVREWGVPIRTTGEKAYGTLSTL
jgi:hypothetical protein